MKRFYLGDAWIPPENILMVINREVFCEVIMNKAEVPIREYLIEILGNENALKLMNTNGIAGCRFNVPVGHKAIPSKSEKLLIDAIGLDATNIVIYHFGGSQVYFPRDSTLKRVERNQKIVNMYNKGSCIRELAGLFEMSDRNIWSILKTTDMSAIN